MASTIVKENNAIMMTTPLVKVSFECRNTKDSMDEYLNDLEEEANHMKHEQSKKYALYKINSLREFNAIRKCMNDLIISEFHDTILSLGRL